MRPILLDTHAAVWSVEGNVLARAATAIDAAAARGELLLSPITAWEIGMLVRKGKLGLAATAHDVHAEADYHAPALMGDWIRMRTHIEKVGASSVRWKIVMFNETAAAASAVLSLTVACINRATKKSMPLPARVREALTFR